MSMSIDYGKLSQSSKNKYITLTKRLDKRGITVKQAVSMNDASLKKTLKFKGSNVSFNALRRNINSINAKRIGYDRVKLLIVDASLREKTVPDIKFAKVKYAHTLGHNRFFYGVDTARKLGYKEPEKAVDIAIRSVKAFGYKRLNKRQKKVVDSISP